MTEIHGDHRATLEKILRHPAGGNIEWRENATFERYLLSEDTVSRAKTGAAPHGG